MIEQENNFGNIKDDTTSASANVLNHIASKSNLPLKEVFDTLPAAIYATDAEGHLTYFNQAAAEFSGREPQLGTDEWCVTWKLFYPDGTPMAHDECPMATALKEAHSIEGAVAMAERPDGKRIWFNAYPSPLFDDEGNVIGGINLLIDITERKQAEKKLLRKERKLTDFFENAVMGLHWVGKDGTILRANRAEMNMLGYSPDEYIGRNIVDFHADEEVINDILRRLKAGEELRDYKARLRCKDGSIRHVLINSNVFEENGEFIHTRCFTRDITGREKALQKLQESEEKYRSLFESMDEGFCIIEVIFDENDKAIDYLFLDVNPSFERQTGIKDAKGKTMRQIAPNHEEHWFEMYGKVALTGESMRFERPAEELNRWFSIYAFRYGHPEDRQVAVLFNDITERKKNEHSEALLGAIVEGSDDAIISKNLNGIITSWNSGAKRLFGYTADEAIGQSITMLIPPDRLDEEDEILSKLRRGERIEHFETIRMRKDGTLRNISLTISPVRDSSGQIIGASKIARDITEEKNTKRKLQEMNETLEERVKERTSSLLSYQKRLRKLASRLNKAEENERHRLASELHDNLGQMLAVGKIKLDLIQRDELPEQLLYKVIDLGELIDDALVYTRELMSDLKPPPSINKEDVGTVIEWLANKMKKHNLKVAVEDDGQPKPMREEVRTTIVQCVRELFFNIVKHSGVDEALVTLSRKSGEVQVTVEDEGKGFDLNNMKKDLNEGGFGLFNIQERVDLLGGEIDISSSPGKGTKVVVTIKVEESEEAGKTNKNGRGGEKHFSSKSDKKVRVLLVDDHQMMREGLRKIVNEQEDLTVIAEASDGKEAIKLAQETSPDVIIMDVNMPVMNGIDATQRITAEMGKRIRIIGLSLHPHDHVVDSMHSAGASAYLTKNEAFETLCATIRSEVALARE